MGQLDLFAVDNTAEILELIERGALFVVNHSGGKDSQRMFIKIRELVPAEQVLVIHAPLEGVEWKGTLEHIENTIGNYPLVLANAVKTFLDMVEHRGMWPSPSNRQCTSDLKRGPIEREIRRYLKDRPQFNGLIVNCMGMRAEESSNRAKLDTLKKSERNSKAEREWYEWLPIHDYSITQVFDGIAQAGENPHWAYSKGMSRLSCCFCIMASDKDLTIAAKYNPEMYQLFVKTERRLNHTLSMSQRPLDQITGIEVAA